MDSALDRTKMDGDDPTRDLDPSEDRARAMQLAHAILNSVHEGGDRADTKASIVFAGLTFLMTVALATTPALRDWAASHEPFGWVVFGMAAICWLLIVSAAALVGWSIYPRLGSTYAYDPSRPLQPGDLVYFGRLRSIPPERIADALASSVADGSLLLDLSEQLHTSSQIAWEKHEQLQQGLRLVAAAAALGLVAVTSWLIVGPS